jgi:hypothetical protein
MNENLQCPIDFVTINENQARLTAFQVVLIIIIWLLSGDTILPVFLIVDFLLRASNFGNYSILNKISIFFIKKLSIENKPVERGPKRFAALVGLLFTVSIAILSLTENSIPSKILAFVLLIFASLEAFVGFCAGCYVYTFFILIFKKLKGNLISK